MLISFNWLNEFISCRDVGPEKVAHCLTMAGLEVEGIHYLGDDIKGSIVGLISSVESHPREKRWKVCKVSLGKEQVQIVSGAPYLEVGKRVIVAPPGVLLPNGMRVETISLKGVESQGNFVSEIELGLAEGGEVETVIFVDKEEPGSPAASLLWMDDYILETSPTPNRPDCLGMFGVAREVSAILNRPLNPPEISFPEDGPPIDEIVDVKIEDPELCSRYAARYMDGVEVKPSPLWIKVRLKAIGTRPISNVVDATNYVLMELGHPLHAFDFEDIRGEKVLVRRAKLGEVIVTLDGVDRELDSEVLVIADTERVIALAGIMGGANSEVKGRTTKVLIESAYFDPISIRKTSKRLNLSTEASKRFERGTDIKGLIMALNRTTHLMYELARGKVAKGTKDAYPKPHRPKKLSLSIHKLNSILGCEVPPAQVESILKRLQFKPQMKGGKVEVEVPTFRALDVTREIDLVEEVARIYGYEKIPSTMPAGPLPRESIKSDNDLIIQVEEILSALGLREVINYSFINPHYIKRLQLSKEARSRPLAVLNPLSKEMAVMRTTLIPGLLETAERNQKIQENDMALFEVGRVFIKREGVEERLHVGALCMGKRPSYWDEKGRDYDFFFIKGVAEVLISKLSGGYFEVERTIEPFLHPGRATRVIAHHLPVGFIGEVHPKIAENHGFSSRCYVMELDLGAISSISQERSFRLLPKYPGTSRDLSLVAPLELSHKEILEAISNLSPPTVKQVKLIDFYTGPPIETGKKSLTYSLLYISGERTLTDDEVEREQIRLISALEQQLPIKIRR